jgi:hypothetical protein
MDDFWRMTHNTIVLGGKEKQAGKRFRIQQIDTAPAYFDAPSKGWVGWLKRLFRT